MAEHNDIGKIGEEAALLELRKEGYRILETNWRFGKDEVDIIAEEGDYLVFAEVKTRTNTYFGEPEMSVTRSKQKFLVRAAQNYADKFGSEKEIRFDIVSVIYQYNNATARIIRDAFYPVL